MIDVFKSIGYGSTMTWLKPGYAPLTPTSFPSLSRRRGHTFAVLDCMTQATAGHAAASVNSTRNRWSANTLIFSACLGWRRADTPLSQIYIFVIRPAGQRGATAFIRRPLAARRARPHHEIALNPQQDMVFCRNHLSVPGVTVEVRARLLSVSRPVVDIPRSCVLRRKL